MNSVLVLKREILLDDPDGVLLTNEVVAKLSSISIDDEAEINYIQEIWKYIEEKDEDYLNDLVAAFRECGTSTNLPERFFNRHYESEEVAHSITGSDLWVGWTYWYGGGKHGNPGEIDWIDDAYLVSMQTEMRPVQIFKPL